MMDLDNRHIAAALAKIGSVLLQIIIISAFLLPPIETSAQPVNSTAQCILALEESRNRLLEIAAQMQRDGMTDEAFARLLLWQDSFRDEVNTAGIGDHIEGIATGTGMGVLASIVAGGPPGVGVAALGAIFGSVYVETKTLLQTLNNWGNVDANTAFYQYLLDYLEYGRVGSVTNSAMEDFIRLHSSTLQQLTGTRPPANGANLHQYLQSHAESLMLFFGYFEEKIGPEAFPRWKFPAAPGRYGTSRLSVGYYRNLLAGSIAEQLRELAQEISRLQENGCPEDIATATVEFSGEIINSTYPQFIISDAPRAAIELSVTGHFEFPVTTILSPKSCPEGFNCGTVTTQISEFSTSNNLLSSEVLWCSGVSDKWLMEYEIFFLDEFGNSSNKVDIKVLCRSQ